MSGNIQPKPSTLVKSIELLKAIAPDAPNDLVAERAVALSNVMAATSAALSNRTAQERVRGGAAEEMLGGRIKRQSILDDPNSCVLKDFFKSIYKREPTEKEIEELRLGFDGGLKSVIKKEEKTFKKKEVTFEALYKLQEKNWDKVIKKLSKDELECNGCDKVSKSFKKCSRCREVVYCSPECQRAHWPTHKAVCVVKASGAGAGAGSAASKS